jgi:hypothetical protein
MVLWSLLEKMFHLTNGADGMRVPRPTVFGMVFSPDNFQYVLLYLTLAIAVAATFAVQRFLESPTGNMLRAIKSNETRLEYLGVSARRILLIGYVISAACWSPSPSRSRRRNSPIGPSRASSSSLPFSAASAMRWAPLPDRRCSNWCASMHRPSSPTPGN